MADPVDAGQALVIGWHAVQVEHQLAAEGLGTFAVDRGWRVYLDPATLAGWGPAVVGGVLVHEVGHLVRAHAERADALGADVDHDRWNLAGDIAINDDLVAAGIPLPAGAVTPTGLGLENGGIEEAYYAQLASRRGAGLAGTGAADDGCGSGTGGPAAPWELAVDDPGARGIVRQVHPALGSA